MEALRICRKPENGVLSIVLPENMLHNKDFEIIIIPLEHKKQRVTKQFQPSDYFGIWSSKNIDADKVSKEMRDEWDHVL
ncbi:MAG: hypothetical protein V2I97_12765 [Desulfococcaceae bacterium]|jgi:hypothetical protein|nr:hypothetical protein [Desulfococcaceae bacterium]